MANTPEGRTPAGGQGAADGQRSGGEQPHSAPEPLIGAGIERGTPGEEGADAAGAAVHWDPGLRDVPLPPAKGD
ncbi:MAG TPA: hypothetical protein VFY65_07825, partial [Longimicrobium sp.]|nr:hypothetical protein [Longimicrobium sp.]